MPEPYVYYDRRVVSSTKTQFFHESMGRSPDGPLATNMPKDLQFDVNIRITKIAVVLEPVVLSSTAAADTGLLDEYVKFLETAYIELQVGEESVKYFPVIACLASVKAEGSLHYTQASAANATELIASLGPALPEGGLPVDITVPANTDFKFWLKQKEAVNVGLVQVLLFAERGV